MIHIFGQDVSYNQDYCLFFIVHEVVWSIVTIRGDMRTSFEFQMNLEDEEVQKVAICRFATL